MYNTDSHLLAGAQHGSVDRKWRLRWEVSGGWSLPGDQCWVSVSLSRPFLEGLLGRFNVEPPRLNRGSDETSVGAPARVVMYTMRRISVRLLQFWSWSLDWLISQYYKF